MKFVIQRVKSASVNIDDKIYSSTGKGLLVLFCAERGDDEDTLRFLCAKLLKLRIFEDDKGKMNLSVWDIKGEILVVPQFTLAADCRKGTRPSFDRAMEPLSARQMYEKCVDLLKESALVVKTGVFASDMKVSLINDGPVTIILD